MNKLFDSTLYNGCDYLSMLGFKLIHVSEKGDSPQFSLHKTTRCNLIYHLQESQGCVIRKMLYTEIHGGFCLFRTPVDK